MPRRRSLRSLRCSSAAVCVGALLVLVPLVARAQTTDSSATTTATLPAVDSTGGVSTAPDTMAAAQVTTSTTGGGDTTPGASDQARATAGGRVMPPWLPPDSADQAAHRPVLPSMRDGIALTPAQEAAMEAARATYRPQLQTLTDQLQAALAARADTTALADSLRQVSGAQRDAVLAVLTAGQRAQYDANVQRAQAIQAAHQP